MKLREMLHSRKVLVALTCILMVITYMQFFVFSNAVGGEVTAKKAAEKDAIEQKANKDTTTDTQTGKTPIIQPRNWGGKNYSSIDPFQEMWLMQEEMDKLFNQTFNRFQHSPGFTVANPTQMIFSPRIDLKDDSKNYVVKMDVPGVKKENIEITLKNRFLTISGVRREEAKKKTDKMVTMERRLGEFSRTFALPGPVDEKKLKAVCRDGVLTVILPKIAKEKDEIEIKIEDQ